MTRRTAKTFERGEAVEILVGRHHPVWENGRYVRRCVSPVGYHTVMAFDVPISVPSRRIRKRTP